MQGEQSVQGSFGINTLLNGTAGGMGQGPPDPQNLQSSHALAAAAAAQSGVVHNNLVPLGT